MGIPREGTYKLNVTRLCTWTIARDGRRSYVVDARHGINRNTFSGGADVTFVGDKISFTESDGSSHAFKPALVYAFKAEPGVIIVYDTTFPAGWYCLSLPTYRFNYPGETFLFTSYPPSEYYPDTSLPYGCWSPRDNFVPFPWDDDPYYVDFGPPECFLAGTLIAMADGEKPIEDISPGDRVKIRSGRYLQSAIVAWVGEQRVYAQTHLPSDVAGYPITIKAGALGEGQPRRDLRLTSEHRVVVEGHLVPARALVNGKSILYDTSCTSFSVYHLETFDHAIIFAEGLPVETFHETGQRARFQKSRAISTKFLTRSNPHTHPALPIGLPPRQMQSFWNKVAKRAGLRHAESVNKTDSSTEFLDLLKVRGACGEILNLHRIDAERFQIDVPVTARKLTLLSPRFRFCDLHGPYHDDRRNLGVLVEEIKMFKKSSAEAAQKLVPFSLGDGWHGDPSFPRWTDGAGVLILHDETDEVPVARVTVQLQINSAVYRPL